MGPSGVCMLTARPLKHGMTVGGVGKRLYSVDVGAQGKSVQVDPDRKREK